MKDKVRENAKLPFSIFLWYSFKILFAEKCSITQIYIVSADKTRGGKIMRIIVGCDLKEFKKYYKTLDDLHDYFRTRGIADVKFGELGGVEEGIIRRDPSHLIVLRENNEIIGHAIWHESNTDEHRAGDPRDEEDKRILRKLAGGKKDVIELHEIWLRQKHRGKGYGKQMFEFFEDFLRKRGYNSIVYYADHPAAIAICRNRGYKEDFLEKEKWYVFYLSLSCR
jgi:GNAT superfamily N-acetyltransferase